MDWTCFSPERTRLGSLPGVLRHSCASRQQPSFPMRGIPLPRAPGEAVWVRREGFWHSPRWYSCYSHGSQEKLGEGGRVKILLGHMGRKRCISPAFLMHGSRKHLCTDYEALSNPTPAYFKISYKWGGFLNGEGGSTVPHFGRHATGSSSFTAQTWLLSLHSGGQAGALCPSGRISTCSAPACPSKSVSRTGP